MKTVSIIFMLIVFANIIWLICEVLRIERENEKMKRDEEYRCINCMWFIEVKCDRKGHCLLDSEPKDYNNKACDFFEKDNDEE